MCFLLLSFKIKVLRGGAECIYMSEHCYTTPSRVWTSLALVDGIENCSTLFLSVGSASSSILLSDYSKVCSLALKGCEDAKGWEAKPDNKYLVIIIDDTLPEVIDHDYEGNLVSRSSAEVFNAA